MQNMSVYNESGFNIGFASRPGREKKHNADNYTVFDTRSFAEPGVFGEVSVQVAMVADGGGRARGQIASHLAIQTLYELVNNNPHMPIMQRLLTALHEANATIQRHILLEPGLEGMGVMTVVAAVVGDTLMVLHVGNSRAYLVRDGHAHCLTVDQLPVIQGGSFRGSDEPDAPVQDLLPPRLGTPDLPQIDTSIVDYFRGPFEQQWLRQMPRVDYIRLQPNDVVMLCTDGLTDAVSTEQIAGTISQFGVREAANYLSDLARQAGSKDDSTLIVLQRSMKMATSPSVPIMSKMATLNIPSLGNHRGLPRPAIWGLASLILAAGVWFTITGLTGRAEGGSTAATPTVAAPQIADSSPGGAVAALQPTETATQNPSQSSAAATTQGTPRQTPTKVVTATSSPMVIPTEIAPAVAQVDTSSPFSETELVSTTLALSSTAALLETLITSATSALSITSVPSETSIPSVTAALSLTSTLSETSIPSTTLALSTTSILSKSAIVSTTASAAVTASVPITATATAAPTLPAAPTATPAPTLPPAPTPTPRPTQPPAPTAAIASQPNPATFWQGQYVTLVAPIEEEMMVDRATFTWNPLPFALPGGYAYEVVFWPRGGDAMTQGQGWGGVSVNPSITIDFAGAGVQPGQYNWGVLLVQTHPEYKRLAQLSQKRVVNINRRQ